MWIAIKQFENNFRYIKELDALYLFLQKDLRLGVDLSDLLRAEIVYSISAFDKLIHELIRIGMVEAFQGNRNKTSRFLNFQVSSNTLIEILNNNNTANLPSEYWFEQEVVLKNNHISYQDPSKITEGLNYIWPEQYKWQQISNKLGQEERTIKTTLNNIVNRRNKIVHESDIDLQTGHKNKIEHSDVTFSTSFIEELGRTIYGCVR